MCTGNPTRKTNKIMKRLIPTLCLLVSINCTVIYSQSKTELKNNFYDAESWILFEAYKDALPIYLQLLEKYPDNANFKYRIGECYLNIEGAKSKAVPYLEEAAANIDPLYKEGKFKEEGAPFDVLYYLANAYRINNQLDKAVETYRKFRQNMDKVVYDSAIVDMQIQSCLNARELMAKPVIVKKTGLGDMINGGNSTFNPVVSDKEDMIVFSRSEAFYDAILYSIKKDGEWMPPVNMNEILKVDRDLFPTSLSADGKTLYLYSSADYDGVIYSSAYENGTWDPLVKLNSNINTKYWESHATISHDDKKLFFTSNRKGTYGGLDIYVSSRDSSGDWGPAVNLGPVINTQFNEDAPFLSKDDKTLFFSSKGHQNIGGYDIFSSMLKPNGEWTEPVNEGYPLNTTDDEMFYKPSVHMGKGYYAARSERGNGRQDIYLIEFFSGEHPREYVVYGKSTVAGIEEPFTDSVRLTVTNGTKPGKTIISYTDPHTHWYAVSLPFGAYRFDFDGFGGKQLTREFTIPMAYESDSFKVPDTELKRNDFTADLSVGISNRITVTNGDSLEIPLTVEPLSKLTIENWAGKKMISSENHTISKTSYNYKIAPVKGESKVVFHLTDRFNNSTSAEVFIKRVKETQETKAVRPETLIASKETKIPAVKTMTVTPEKETVAPEKKTVIPEKKTVTPETKIAEVEPKVATKEQLASKHELKIVRPEYAPVIAKKKTNAFVTLLLSRSDDNMKKLINDSKADKKEFRDPDDVLSYLRSKAVKNNIQKDEIDRLALRVARTDNVLSKPAINILAANSEGEQKKMLDSIDLSGSGLKSWSDLMQYASGRSNGLISARDLDDLAAIILGDQDPGIALIREKILVFCDKDRNGNVFRDAVTSTDKKDLRLRGKWLNSFYNEALTDKVLPSELSQLLAAISAGPEMSVSQYITDLAGKSIGSVASTLKDFDPSKEKINTPGELLAFMTNSKNISRFPEDETFHSVANLIICNNLSSESILAHRKTSPEGSHWVIYSIAGIVLASLIAMLIFRTGRRRKKSD
jgi:tetratricopeptide (TPR) repeat protein